MNEKSTQLTVVPTPSSLDVAASASASLAKATIEAKFVIALRPENRRSVMAARASILEACQRPKFAEGAMYHVKRGSKQNANGQWVDNLIEGPSIRFAETALQAWKNVDVSQVIAWENDEYRLVRITVTDLENNISYTDEAMLAKTIERSKLKQGQEAIARRTNSDGREVFIVRATDEEMQNKTNIAKSKSIRNSGLRLIPEDIVEEAMEAVVRTNEKGGDDPKAGIKKVLDAFSALGVSPSEVEAYLDHPLETISPKELTSLRAMYTALRDGETTWNDYRPKPAEPKATVKPPAKPAPAAKEAAPPAETPPPAAAKEAEPPARKPRTVDVPPPTPTAKEATGLLPAIRSRNITEDEAMAAIHKWWPQTETIGTIADFTELHANLADRILKSMDDFQNVVLEMREGKLL